MATYRGTRNAFGAPGIDPRWTAGDKEGVGTAYSASSRLWFTLTRGILTELYYPTVDRPQTRDLQFLFTDGETFFHEEKRHLISTTERIGCSLGYKTTSADPGNRYRFIKEIVSDPHLPCLILDCKIEGDEDFLKKLKVYVLCAPHLDGGGRGNDARILDVAGRAILSAARNNIHLTLSATVPFSRASCGYVGCSDGWTDLAHNFRMDWEFDSALQGNVALTGEIDLSGGREFTLCAAFGDSLHSSITTLLQVLNSPYQDHRARFIEQWDRPQKALLPLQSASGDGGHLYQTSFNLLLAHEDKNYQGAMIASLSIPWGESKNDEEGLAGYHLVWVRDLVQSATGLLAAGNIRTPQKAVWYLAASQQPDGGFAQNFWINGDAYWHGIQLDELAFPIMLIYRLVKQDLLSRYTVNTAVRAIAYLILQGPCTRQERWEESGGYSPSTLAAIIAALICAAAMARQHGFPDRAQFVEEYADYLVAHLEEWTVTESGTLLPGVKRHFVRINPAEPGQAPLPGSLERATVHIANRPPGSPSEFAARDIVDPGFLELVRYGVLRPGDPLVEDSLRVVDSVCKVETPFGPAWRRYNNDGYGQGPNGASFQTHGIGRAWPLLTGERGHYELAAGRDPAPYLRAMERFSGVTGMLPEQVWDEPDLPGGRLRTGGPTGSAMPLMWAHAEYIKLLRSAHDGRVYDLIPEAAARYAVPKRRLAAIDFWCFNHPIAAMQPGRSLRVVAGAPFRLRWTASDWRDQRDDPSAAIVPGLQFFDIAVPAGQRAPVRFTFFWLDGSHWHGSDFAVSMT